jgi:hypothetical protein
MYIILVHSLSKFLHWCICISKRKSPNYPAPLALKFWNEPKFDFKIYIILDKVETMSMCMKFMDNKKEYEVDISLKKLELGSLKRLE